MGRTEDLPEVPAIETKAVTVSWERVLAETRASEFSSTLRTLGAVTGAAAGIARQLRRARDQQRERRSARTATAQTKLEGRVAALEKENAGIKRENAAIKVELATLRQRLDRDVAGPVASLVEAGRITEARQLVGLLAQASPSLTLERWSQVLAPPVVHSENQATGSPFARNAEWLRQNSEAHADKWVALRDGTLVDEDPSRVALQRRLEQANALEGVTFVRL
jgi:4-hydroxy-L-threonine phosphate dehydrogenase PdxA